MVVHMDDHLVHRGHAVFDTTEIVDGFLYQLPEHLQRFQHSAELAGLVSPHSMEQIYRIICETAAASTQINGEPPRKQSLHFSSWRFPCGCLILHPFWSYGVSSLLCQQLPCGN